jgi:4-amino-4-deoxy-L-arabinose transferase-like glycosyltransferase
MQTTVNKPIEADQRTLGNATMILTVIAAVRIFHLLFLYPVDLSPDEAQYWYWAQSLDWGYFSKPPLIAWAIAGTTALCGSAEGCVRLSAPLFQFGTSLFILSIGNRLFSHRIGLWSAVAFATLPGISFASVTISTDTPLLFFWAAALYAVVRLMEKSSLFWWALLGAAIGLGMMAKYAMAFFVLSLILLVVFDAKARSVFLNWGSLIAAVLAMAIFAPNVVWNARHGFVTLAHTEANANIGQNLFHPAALGEFVLSQLGVFGPILFFALIWLVVCHARLLFQSHYRLLFLFAAPPLMVMIALSVLSRANANWAAPAYISGALLVVAFLINDGKRMLVTASVALHVGVAVIFFAVAGWAFTRPDVLPKWADPFPRIRAWHSYGSSISSIAATVPHRGYLFEDRPELVEMLYYGLPQPVEVWKWRPGAAIHDHFDLTRSVADAPPGPLVLVAPDGDAQMIASHFTDVQPIGDMRQFLGHGRERSFRLILVDGFKGYANEATKPAP